MICYIYYSIFKALFAEAFKEYFVLTTNVDHCFQKAGFAKERLFYTQGDYGLFQCSRPCGIDTYDNYNAIRSMVLSQGFRLTETKELLFPENGTPAMTVPSGLIPACPKCGAPMAMNLRADNTFVEDEGWLLAAERYSKFIKTHRDGHVLFLELGVGYNTPGIIKYPFWQMTASNPSATYACLNYWPFVLMKSKGSQFAWMEILALCWSKR